MVHITAYPCSVSYLRGKATMLRMVVINPGLMTRRRRGRRCAYLMRPALPSSSCGESFPQTDIKLGFVLMTSGRININTILSCSGRCSSLGFIPEVNIQLAVASMLIPSRVWVGTSKDERGPNCLAKYAHMFSAEAHCASRFKLYWTLTRAPDYDNRTLLMG